MSGLAPHIPHGSDTHLVRCGLAPMEGVTGFAARLWYFLTSSPYWMSTPFLRVTKDSARMKRLPEDFIPELIHQLPSPYGLTPQMMASDADSFLSAAEHVLRVSDFVEINCGCPSPRVVGHGAGSSLLADSYEFGRMIERLSSAVGPNKLAVKMRLGFNQDEEFDDLLAAIKNLPLKHLTVHARTRADRYQGKARWQKIAEAKANCSFNVIGSGDILSSEDISRIRAEAPAVNAGIIGRGAIRNPWIFSEIKAGNNTTLTKDTLIYALACFALLEQGECENLQQLIAIKPDICSSGPCGVDEQKWQGMFTTLLKFQSLPDSTSPQELALSRAGLGRLKMMWNSLRSSLPDTFWITPILRASSVREFFVTIDEISKIHENKIGISSIDVRHHPERDRFYAGSGTNQESKPELHLTLSEAASP